MVSSVHPNALKRPFQRSQSPQNVGNSDVLSNKRPHLEVSDSFHLRSTETTSGLELPTWEFLREQPSSPSPPIVSYSRATSVKSEEVDELKDDISLPSSEHKVKLEEPVIVAPIQLTKHQFRVELSIEKVKKIKPEPSTSTLQTVQSRELSQYTTPSLETRIKDAVYPAVNEGKLFAVQNFIKKELCDYQQQGGDYTEITKWAANIAEQAAPAGSKIKTRFTTLKPAKVAKKKSTKNSS